MVIDHSSIPIMCELDPGLQLILIQQYLEYFPKNLMWYSLAAKVTGSGLKQSNPLVVGYGLIN
jgi:hypothetical protein